MQSADDAVSRSRADWLIPAGLILLCVLPLRRARSVRRKPNQPYRASVPKAAYVRVRGTVGCSADDQRGPRRALETVA